jgi:signal transduction histidine kinase
VVVAATVMSAIVTVVVPRGEPVRLTNAVFRISRKLFELRSDVLKHDYERRDRAMSRFAPFTLVALAFVWLTAVLLGFTSIFYALADELSWAYAFEASGSSLMTLGFVAVEGVDLYIVAFAEAGLGLLLLALLITYLPTMYAAFSRREALVTRTSISAGTPPTPWALIERYHRIAGFDRMEANIWAPWTAGFVDLEESHTSLSALAMFRPPQPHRSWVTAAGCLLDTAALLQSSVDGFDEPPAQLTMRAGFLSLRAIADHHRIPYPPDPQPGDPIAITREEWERVLDDLAAIGVAVTADRDRAWLDFAGWRVNYDAVLLGLAEFTMAPYAPWSADRSPVVEDPGPH